LLASSPTVLAGVLAKEDVLAGVLLREKMAQMLIVAILAGDLASSARQGRDRRRPSWLQLLQYLTKLAATTAILDRAGCNYCNT
jgi:hypothetical protein